MVKEGFGDVSIENVLRKGGRGVFGIVTGVAGVWVRFAMDNQYPAFRVDAREVGGEAE